jgi:hypothetical protein
MNQMNAREIVGLIRDLHAFAEHYKDDSPITSRLLIQAACTVRELSIELLDSNHLALLLADELKDQEENL